MDGQLVVLRSAVRRLIGEVQFLEGCTDERRNLLVIGGRKEEPPTHMRQHLDDFFHLCLKAQFQALVEFINDEYADCRAVNILFAQVVCRTTRGGDDDVRLHFAQHPMFIHRCPSAIAGHSPQPTFHRLDDIHRLCSQLSRRDEDECPWPRSKLERLLCMTSG